MHACRRKYHHIDKRTELQKTFNHPSVLLFLFGAERDHFFPPHTCKAMFGRIDTILTPLHTGAEKVMVWERNLCVSIVDRNALLDLPNQTPVKSKSPVCAVTPLYLSFVLFVAITLQKQHAIFALKSKKSG